MALGNKNKDGELIALKPVFKDGDKYISPYFKVRRKVDGQWTIQEDGVSSVDGELVKITIKDESYNGNDYKDIAVYLQDRAASETYLINLRFNIATRSLFNALVNLETFDNVSVSLYQDKKSGYGRYGVWQNDELVKWKYAIEDLPPVVETTFQGKVLKDYTDVDALFEKELLELNDRASKAKGSALAQAGSEAGDPESGQEDPADDGIPF